MLCVRLSVCVCGGVGNVVGQGTQCGCKYLVFVLLATEKGTIAMIAECRDVLYPSCFCYLFSLVLNVVAYLFG